jgi:hypothetical protein
MHPRRVLMLVPVLAILTACGSGSSTSKAEPSTQSTKVAKTTTTSSTRAPGKPGPPGPPGPPGVSGYEIRENTASTAINDTQTFRTLDAIVQCPTGKKAIGGGGSTAVSHADPTNNYGIVAASEPTNGGTAWRVTGAVFDRNDGSPGSFVVKATVICTVVT